MVELGLLDKLEGEGARLLGGLPPRMQVLLSGRAPIVRDGLTLDPSMQLILALRQRIGAPELTASTPEAARARARRDARVHGGLPIPIGSVRELQVPGATRPLAGRLYSPIDRSPQPLIVFIHGGGFVIGDLDTHDRACRLLAVHARANVLAVAYRKAPEEPFPAAVDDSLAAFEWAVASAAALGADPSRVAVAGDSAGGNLAANVARLAKTAPSLQVLIYPTTDRTRVTRSLELFADGFYLTRADIDWFQQQYTGGKDLDDPRVSPLLAKDLGGLAPALVVTAGFDPLRDEGEAFAHALRDAGTPATLRRFDGLVHGFINMTAVSRAAHHALVELAQKTRALLDGR